MISDVFVQRSLTRTTVVLHYLCFRIKTVDTFLPQRSTYASKNQNNVIISYLKRKLNMTRENYCIILLFISNTENREK